MNLDLQHCNTTPSLFNKGKVKKIIIANKVIKDGKIIHSIQAREVYPSMFLFEKEYPTPKQLNRIYKSKPILLNHLN